MEQKQKQKLIFPEVMAIAFITVGILIIILLMFVTNFDMLFSFGDGAGQKYGNLGQYIEGFVGSMWNLASILLFYAALKYQKDELSAQGDHLSQQLDEFKAQTEQAKKSNIVLETQKHENTFFQLLRFHTEIVNSMDIEVNKFGLPNRDDPSIMIKITGRSCFVEYFKSYKIYFNSYIEDYMTDEFNIKTAKKLINRSYSAFFEEYQADLGHYFRNLLNIVHFIDSKEFEDKDFYIDLICSQLSNYELLLIYFHCLSKLGREFKSLIEKYSLLRNTPEDEFVVLTKELYDINAFFITEIEYADEEEEDGKSFTEMSGGHSGDDEEESGDFDDFGSEGMDFEEQDIMDMLDGKSEFEQKVKGKGFSSETEVDLDFLFGDKENVAKPFKKKQSESKSGIATIKDGGFDPFAAASELSNVENLDFDKLFAEGNLDGMNLHTMEDSLLDMEGGMIRDAMNNSEDDSDKGESSEFDLSKFMKKPPSKSTKPKPKPIPVKKDIEPIESIDEDSISIADFKKFVGAAKEQIPSTKVDNKAKSEFPDENPDLSDLEDFEKFAKSEFPDENPDLSDLEDFEKFAKSEFPEENPDLSNLEDFEKFVKSEFPDESPEVLGKKILDNSSIDDEFGDLSDNFESDELMNEIEIQKNDEKIDKLVFDDTLPESGIEDFTPDAIWRDEKDRLIEIKENIDEKNTTPGDNADISNKKNIGKELLKKWNTEKKSQQPKNK
ncbi:MAG: hypothetical protein HW421_3410 [Ignavibacteria bacterium]|nr:hypothetical protein [Ignavibacteria bacterium]